MSGCGKHDLAALDAECSGPNAVLQGHPSSPRKLHHPRSHLSPISPRFVRSRQTHHFFTQLFPQTHSGTGPAIASKARLLGLLSQFAHLLEQVGSTPPHRLGTAAVYGRQLQVYIRNQVLALCALHYQANTARGVRTGTSGEVDWAVFTEQSLSLPITGDSKLSVPTHLSVELRTLKSTCTVRAPGQ